MPRRWVRVTQFSQKQIEKLPQFKEGTPAKQWTEGVRAEYDAIAQAELTKKQRKEHLKKKYLDLLAEYHCDKLRKRCNVDLGILMFKLLARKEEEFGGGEADYRSSRF